MPQLPGSVLPDCVERLAKARKATG